MFVGTCECPQEHSLHTGMLSGFGLSASSREERGAPVDWAFRRCETEVALNGEKAQRGREGHSKEKHLQRPEGVGVEEPRQC